LYLHCFSLIPCYVRVAATNRSDFTVYYINLCDVIRLVLVVYVQFCVRSWCSVWKYCRCVLFLLCVVSQCFAYCICGDYTTLVVVHSCSFSRKLKKGGTSTLDYHHHVDGMRPRLWTAATDWLTVHPTGNILLHVGFPWWHDLCTL
jgi:hypothetical protein